MMTRVVRFVTDLVTAGMRLSGIEAGLGHRRGMSGKQLDLGLEVKESGLGWKLRDEPC